MATINGIRHFKDEQDYREHFIVKSEIDKYLPGGRHFIDEDLINRTLAEADAKEALRLAMHKLPCTCKICSREQLNSQNEESAPASAAAPVEEGGEEA